MEQFKIALTGASGFVGSHIAEQLVHQGHSLTCLLRTSSKMDYLENLDIIKIIGDINNPGSLKEFAEDQDIVIHAAGRTKARHESEYILANTIGTKNLLEAVSQFNPGIKRFIFISSQAAVGPTPTDEPLDETAKLNPITAYGRSKAGAEEICEEFMDQTPITIIRPPTVYGPRDKDVFNYFRLINRGVQPIVGEENMLSVVSVQNLVHGVLLATQVSGQKLQCFFVTDDGHYTWAHFAGMIATALNKRPVKVKIPFWLVDLVARIAETHGKLTGRPTLFNREKILEMKQPRWTVKNDKAKQELGYEPIVTTQEGIEGTANWYIDNRWLK